MHFIYFRLFLAIYNKLDICELSEVAIYLKIPEQISTMSNSYFDVNKIFCFQIL